MQSPLTNITLKNDYKNGLLYVIYNGPPQTIYGHHSLSPAYSEYDLIKAVIQCHNFIDFINNPTERIVCAHLESHGNSFCKLPIPMTRNIAISIIKHDYKKYDEFNKQFNFTEPEIKEMIHANPYLIKYAKQPNFNMYITAINKIVGKNNGSKYTEIFSGGSGIWHKSIDAEFAGCINCDVLSKEDVYKLYDILIKENSRSVYYMNPQFIKKELILKHIGVHNDFLVSDKFKLIPLSEEDKRDLYHTSFTSSQYNIKYIPHQYQTIDMIMQIFHGNEYKFQSLCEYLNPNLIDRQLILSHKKFMFTLIKSQIFKDIKMLNDDRIEIYNVAINENIFSFEYISHNFQTDDMIQLVLNSSSPEVVRLYKFIRGYESMCKEIYDTAFQRDPRCVEFIPDEFKTYDMCIIAIKNNPYNIKYVPKIIQDKNICKLAADNNYGLIKYCEYIDYDMINNIKTQTKGISKRYVYSFVNDLSEDQIIQIVSMFPNSIGNIDKSKLTDKIIIVALGANGYAIEHVPTHRLTDEFVDIALSQQPLAKKYVENRYKKS